MGIIVKKKSSADYISNYDLETLYNYPFDGGRFFKIVFQDENSTKIQLSTKTYMQVVFKPSRNDIDSIEIKKLVGDDEREKLAFSKFNLQQLKSFLKFIDTIDLQTIAEKKLKLSDDSLDILDDNTKKRITTLLHGNEGAEMIQQLLDNEIVTSQDIINTGFRKTQLKIFDKLLNETGFFETYKQELIDLGELKSGSGNEAVWQKFFENNTWILGYGLDYIFNSELDGKKLEQITTGANFNSSGKRIDGLLKSQGAINSLCFCELKLSSDDLLKQVKDSYRPEAWQISDALSGAIAQVQRTMQKAIKDLNTKIEIKDKADYLTGEELYLYNPKGFILIGKQHEFIKDDKINEMKYSSFEMFRKNLKNIDIITYDELYQRAYYICNKK